MNQYLRAILCSLLAFSIGSSSAKEQIDRSTLYGKLILGYQGWFGCPNDPGQRGWLHWKSGDQFTVDMLPDVSELSANERCFSGLKSENGNPIYLFSSLNSATVDRHFAWMEQFDISGVALQKFATQVLDEQRQLRSDMILNNVRQAAERHGRGFFVMYDLTGMPDDKLELVAEDWKRLLATGLLNSTAYLKHKGRPVLGLWGIGFVGRQSSESVAKLLTSLRGLSRQNGGVTILGGVPTRWREGKGDAGSEANWKNIWSQLDIISPWTVGRYTDNSSADKYKNQILIPDMTEATSMHVDYMPVIFPGSSWANLMLARHEPDKAIPNQIKRRCGAFYWRQAQNALAAGATMIYNAMFDEVDEGTAMFKVVRSRKNLPSSPYFVSIDEDGCAAPSDWYLYLAGKVTEALTQGKLLTNSVPSPQKRND